MATRRYVGIIEPGARNWPISFPAFPGTIATGESVAELLGHDGDPLGSVIDAMQEAGEALPADVDAAPALFSYNPMDCHDPRIFLVPMEIQGKTLQIDVTIEEGLLALLDALAGRTQASRPDLLAAERG